MNHQSKIKAISWSVLRGKHEWLRKKSTCGVALQLLRCRAHVRAPHFSVFGRLVSEAFCAIINILQNEKSMNFL